MELSYRLKEITSLIDKCNVLADIGTDHGYIPIYTVKNGICKKAIASDINKGPVEKAKANVKKEGLEAFISCRQGNGLSTIEINEADVAVIAGMGGNLIRDIILQSFPIVKSIKYMILQPAQNPEVLREFLYNNNFEVLNEAVIYDEGKFYELFKVAYGSDNDYNAYSNYEISDNLLNSRGVWLKSYLEHKIISYEKILTYIVEDSEIASRRREDLNNKILIIREVLKCL